MYLLDFEKLEIGDVILTRSNSRISELVRQSTNSQFSHAILYVGVASIIESDGPGVQANNLQRVLIDDIDNAIVLRLKNGNPTLLRQVEFFARQKIGTQYSVPEARTANASKDLHAKEPNRQFCTRFIAQAFMSAGIKIVDNPDYCIPEELLKSEMFEVVLDVLRKASTAEIKYAQSEAPQTKQNEIHNRIFEKARELSGEDIQTFEQLSELIVKRQELDSDITRFISESGYLTMMEEDKEKNPQHYDSRALATYYKHPEAILNGAFFLIENEDKNRERLYYTLGLLQHVNKLYPREYFQQHISLYQKLIEFSREREMTALKVLKHH